jgi:hypothetical protein
MRSGPSALQGSIRLGHYVPTAHSTHSFAGLQTYGLLIRPAKPSYTAGTLCEMGAKILLKIFKEHIDIIIKK